MKPWHAGLSFWSSRRPASQRRKPTLTSRATLFDAGLHNRSSNRHHNWVHSRIWHSSGAIISYRRHGRQDPSMLDGTSCGSSAGTERLGDLPRWPCSSSAVTRMQPPKRPPAKIRPESPATAIGPGAAEGTLVTRIAIFLEASPLAVRAFWLSDWP